MNPYYRMLGLMEGSGPKAAFATLDSYEKEVFLVEGKKVPIAGRAAEMTIRPEDEGALFLCVGGSSGWYVLCRLEEV